MLISCHTTRRYSQLIASLILILSETVIMPRPPEEGHYEMMAGVRPSVRPSVCLSVSRPNSRTERPRNPKIGMLEAHHTDNLRTYLEVKRSKVKVTRLINVVTDNASYAGVGAFESS